ncbi:MAG: type II toxin-antitoxin system VapC family toxin [Promethearchaeota archaeon]|nr:MAG: type II toxin-antitoxin system VapC family toxin [Candidatus Lokiarchaeota archaeon]
MIFLDTSSAIEILNGAVTLEEVLNKFKTDKFGITSPSIFELFLGIYKLKYLKKKISKQEYQRLNGDLKKFINRLETFSLNENAANLGAKIHMKLKGKGQEIDIFDCLISAVILTNEFKEIITNNRKHFEKIEDLIVYSF